MICNNDGIIVLRCDSLDNWNNVNPVLEYGELVIVLDNNVVKLKAGNGNSKFKDLPFVTVN